MLTTIRRLHRMLVDRLDETSWLRDRAGTNAAWRHYERHARVWSSAAERHEAARAKARSTAEALHATSAASARRRHARYVNKG